MKMYDIMNMYKSEEGQTKINNETFNIAPDTVAIRCLYNPKLRLKRMSNIESRIMKKKSRDSQEMTT